MVGLMNDCWTGKIAVMVAGSRTGWETVKAGGWVVVCWIGKLVYKCWIDSCEDGCEGGWLEVCELG